MRTFVAIDLPEALQVALAHIQSKFRSTLPRSAESNDDVRWTRPEGIHLTLKFLGETSSEQLEKVKQALEVIERFEKFPVAVKGFGFFPDPRRPRVLWAGVEAPPPLAELAGRVEDAMRQLGFPRESRPYAPHLTLARFKLSRPHPELQSLVAHEADLSLGRFEASDFYLFESKISSSGAVYRKVAQFPRDPPVAR